MREFHPEAEQILHQDQYKSKKRTIKHDFSQSWFPKRNLRSKGIYRDHLKVRQ